MDGMKSFGNGWAGGPTIAALPVAGLLPPSASAVASGSASAIPRREGGAIGRAARMGLANQPAPECPKPSPKSSLFGLGLLLGLRTEAWLTWSWRGESGQGSREQNQEGIFPVRVPGCDPLRSPRCGSPSRTIPGPWSRHEPARLLAARLHRWGESPKASRMRALAV